MVNSHCSFELSSSSDALSFPLFYGSPSSDQASTKGPALIPIVGNNTGEGGGGISISKLITFSTPYLDSYMLLQLREPTCTRNCV